MSRQLDFADYLVFLQSSATSLTIESFVETPYELLPVTALIMPAIGGPAPPAPWPLKDVSQDLSANRAST